jgi:sugar phosphate isomerase/epimerase
VSFEPERLGISLATLLPDPMSCDGSAFQRLVPAVAEAGISSVSLWPWHTQAIGMAAARSMLRDSGLNVVTVEALTRWAGGVGPALRDETQVMLDAASLFGADLVLACVLDERIESLSVAIEGFAEVCDLAAARDQQVCLEFLPWSAVPDLKTAWQIVAAADRSNGNIVLDTWHWQRQPGGPNLELLRGIPGDRIRHVQLSDASAGPWDDVLAETMAARLLPGEGVVDIRSVIAVLAETGADPVVAAEVFNSELAARGPAVMARSVKDACSAVLPR